ncbi:MAG: acyl-CoA dehydrogenase family protein [Candidatus Geothermincolales bacterium]
MPHKLAVFAKERIHKTLQDRERDWRQGLSLWREAGELGLLGGPDRGALEAGGEKLVEIANMVASLVEVGQDLGLALSFLDHLLLCAYPLLVFGSRELQDRYLPSLLSGERIGAAAISEFGSGAHPGKMNTVAEPVEGGYVLSGRKGPVTNAPWADVFLVVASTDPERGKAGLSAFLVEREDGVKVEELDLGFIPTSPHGILVLDEVRVPSERMLGEPGWGHQPISRSLFIWERAAMIPSVLALMERWHHRVVSGIDPDTISPDLRVALAQGKVDLTAMRVVAERLLRLTFLETQGGRERLELLLYFGRRLPEWVEAMDQAVLQLPVKASPEVARMSRDLRLVEVGRSMLEWQFQNLIF